MHKGKRGRTNASPGRDGRPGRPQSPILDLTAVEVPPGASAAAAQPDDATHAADMAGSDNTGSAQAGTESQPAPPDAVASASASEHPTAGHPYPPAGTVEGSNFTMTPAEPIDADPDDIARPDKTPDGGGGDADATRRSASVPAIAAMTIAPQVETLRAAPEQDDEAPRAGFGAGGGSGAQSGAGFGAAPASPPPGGSRSGPGIAGGLLAGLLAGAGAAFGILWFAGLYPPPQAGGGDAQRITALESQMGQLAARPAPAPDPAVEDLAGRVAKLESAQPANANQTQESRAQEISALTTRLAELAKRVGTNETAAGTTATAIAEIRKRLDAMAGTVESARDSANRAAGAATTAAADASTAVETMRKRVQALEEGAAKLQAAERKPDRDAAGRLATAALALRLAVEQGVPFASELTIVKAASADPAQVAALEPFAAGGVPSAASLAGELKPLLAGLRASAKAQAAANEPAPDGLIDRLQNAAGKLVRVTPVDAPAAGIPDEAAAHALDAAVARGDLPAALVEWGKLPDKMKAATEPWARKVKARLAALAAAQHLSGAAISALSMPASEPVTR